jgi:glycosyltransferase involved in cell wall biosynthesis
MKILFITERFPWPLEDGGNLRTFHVLNALSLEHDVTLLSHAPQIDHEKSIGELEKICQVKTVQAPNRIASMMRIISQPWKWNSSLFVQKNWSKPLFQASRQILETQEFDAVHLNHLDTAAFVTNQNWPTTVFDSHNCISSMAEQLAERPSAGWKRFLYRRESKALKTVEKAVCHQCDIVFACSKQDQESFLKLEPTANVHVVPNGVDTSAVSNSVNSDSADSNSANSNLEFTEQTRIPRIVFTGAMDYAPNVAGVNWFCEHVLPLIRKQQPNILFQIVGRSPTDQVRKWHKLETPQPTSSACTGDEKVGVEVTGRVESVQPFLERASMVVVPLLDGGGTRLKILEAFASKRAVVSTSKGAEGIEAIPGREILIADDPKSFAQEVLRLLKHPAEATQIGNAGHQLAVERYDWRTIGRQILKLYGGLAQQPPMQKTSKFKPNSQFPRTSTAKTNAVKTNTGIFEKVNG